MHWGGHEVPSTAFIWLYDRGGLPTNLGQAERDNARKPSDLMVRA